MMLVPRVNNVFDVLFDDFDRMPFRFGSEDKLMKTDVHETDDKYTLDVELPGYNKEDVTVALKNGYLTISGKHDVSKEEKDDKGHLIRQERSFGSCSRSFYVGENVKQEDVKASFNNGVLALSVAKNAPKEIETDNKIAIE